MKTEKATKSHDSSLHTSSILEPNNTDLDCLKISLIIKRKERKGEKTQALLAKI